MEKLVIERDKWFRGHGSECSMLLDSETQKMCCLGFLALQSGYESKDISDIKAPVDMNLQEVPDNIMSKLLEKAGSEYKLPIKHTAVCYKLMRINDYTEISETEREEQLTKIFKSIDIEVQFV